MTDNILYSVHVYIDGKYVHDHKIPLDYLDPLDHDAFLNGMQVSYTPVISVMRVQR